MIAVVWESRWRKRPDDQSVWFVLYIAVCLSWSWQCHKCNSWLALYKIQIWRKHKKDHLSETERCYQKPKSRGIGEFCPLRKVIKDALVAERASHQEMQCSISWELSLKMRHAGWLSFRMISAQFVTKPAFLEANGCGKWLQCFSQGTWTFVKKCKLIFILEKKLDVYLNKVLFYVNLLP